MEDCRHASKSLSNHTNMMESLDSFTHTGRNARTYCERHSSRTFRENTTPFDFSIPHQRLIRPQLMEPPTHATETSRDSRLNSGKFRWLSFSAGQLFVKLVLAKNLFDTYMHPHDWSLTIPTSDHDEWFTTTKTGNTTVTTEKDKPPLPSYNLVN